MSTMPRQHATPDGKRTWADPSYPLLIHKWYIYVDMEDCMCMYGSIHKEDKSSMCMYGSTNKEDKSIERHALGLTL
jgi:hypothetical protein